MIIHYDIGRVTIVNEKDKVSGIADRQDLLRIIVSVWTGITFRNDRNRGLINCF